MLVLSRKKNESVTAIINGREVEVTVIEIRGDKVRLGFVAERDVAIYRNELMPHIKPPLRAAA